MNDNFAVNQAGRIQVECRCHRETAIGPISRLMAQELLYNEPFMTDVSVFFKHPAKWKFVHDGTMSMNSTNAVVGAKSDPGQIEEVS